MSSQNQLSIFHVDDQQIYRMGLRQFLEENEKLVIVGESGVSRGAADQILGISPSLVIMELSLPDGNGLELIKELRGNGFDGLILVLSNQDESIYAERSLKAGANGFLMKSEDAERVRDAINIVIAGEVFISESMNARLLRRMSNVGAKPEKGSIEQLTDREVQVLELIGSGLMTRDIAERLSISSKTVDTHRINIRQKLGIADVNELIRFAVHWLGAGNLKSNGIGAAH